MAEIKGASLNNRNSGKGYQSSNANVSRWFINGVGAKVSVSGDEVGDYLDAQLDKNEELLSDKPALKQAFEDGMSANVEFNPDLIDSDRSSALANGFENIISANGGDSMSAPLSGRISGLETIAELKVAYEEINAQMVDLNRRRDASLRKRKQRRLDRGDRRVVLSATEKASDEAYNKEHERLYNVLKNINATIDKRSRDSTPLDLIVPPPLLSDMDDGATMGCKAGGDSFTFRERADFLTRGLGVSFIEQGKMMSGALMDAKQLNRVINEQIADNDLYLTTVIGDMLRSAESPQQVFLLAQAQKILRERNNPQIAIELEREKARLKLDMEKELMRYKSELMSIESDKDADEPRFLIDMSGVDRD